MFTGYEIWAAYQGLTGFLALKAFIPAEVDGSHKIKADLEVERLTAANTNSKIYYRISLHFGKAAGK